MVAATDAIPQPSERPSVAENDGGDFALGGPRFGGWGTLLCSFPSIFKVGFWGLVGFPKILEHIFKVHLSSLGVQSEILHAILLLTYNEANYDHYQQWSFREAWQGNSTSRVEA